MQQLVAGPPLLPQAAVAVVVRRDQHQGIGTDAVIAQVLLVEDRAHEAHVGLALQHLTVYLLTGALTQGKAAVGTKGGKARHQRGQHVLHGDGGGGHHQIAGGLHLQLQGEGVAAVQDGLGVFVDAAAFDGQFQLTLAGADQQGHAQVLFQTGHVSADRALGKIELLRGAGKTALLHHGAESFQLFYVQSLHSSQFPFVDSGKIRVSFSVLQQRTAVRRREPGDAAVGGDAAGRGGKSAGEISLPAQLFHGYGPGSGMEGKNDIGLLFSHRSDAISSIAFAAAVTSSMVLNQPKEKRTAP